MIESTRISVVVLTYNRPQELSRTLARLHGLPECPAIIVVDNGSRRGMVAEVARAWPDAQVIRSEANLGAAGRNLGVKAVRTPYVAFCDDDTWWEPGALSRAAQIFDEHPRVGVINARVLVGHDKAEDPTCRRMAASPLIQQADSPGIPLIAFMAGAVVMRTRAYRNVGGYEPRLFLGAEELLMALDMATHGWQMVYAADVVTHHEPSPLRMAMQRKVMTARNRLWTAWLRLPWRDAVRQTTLIWRDAMRERVSWPVFFETVRGLLWVGMNRQVVPEHVARMHGQVFGGRDGRSGGIRRARQ